jgi:hypothetical protein
MVMIEYCYIACMDNESADLYLPQGKQNTGKKTRAEILNELGRDGWEIVGFGNTFEASGHCIYFKRIKSNQT